MLDTAAYRAAIEREPIPLGLYASDALFALSSSGDGVDSAAKLDAELRTSFPDLDRRTQICLEGDFNGGHWFATCGHFVGRFAKPLRGIEADGKPHWLRYGWFDRIEGDRIVESYVILDRAQLMIDTGQWPFAPELGQSWFPAPATHDGCDPGDVGSEDSLKLVEAMIGGLMQYDRQSLTSMGMPRFWTPQFLWYGPGGIGSARGHKDYERAHQQPFLTAFPDRIGGNHKCRIGQGSYVASTGWPSINATHSGDGWLGLPATNKRVTMRVMDFWRAENGLLAENWVMIDIPDLLNQFGIDVFAADPERI